MDIVIVFIICFTSVLIFIGIPIACICRDCAKIKYNIIENDLEN